MVIVRQSGGIYIVFGSLNAGPLADGGGSSGVIAGKYFYSYSLGFKEGEGVFGIAFDLIGQ